MFSFRARFRWRRAAHLGLLGVATFSAMPALAQPTLTAVADSWCPYNCAQGDPRPGYLVDMLSEIFAGTHKLRYQTRPWTAALKDVERGDADLLLATTPATSPGLKLSEPVGVDRTCFFVSRDSNWRYKTVADLNKQRLGVVVDYNYDANGPIDQLLANLRRSKSTLIEAADGKEPLVANLRKLDAGSIDVVIENDSVARYTLRRIALHNAIVPAGCATHYLGTLHVGVTQKRADAADLVARINSGIAELRANGRLGKLMVRYGIADWQAGVR